MDNALSGSRFGMCQNGKYCRREWGPGRRDDEAVRQKSWNISVIYYEATLGHKYLST